MIVAGLSDWGCVLIPTGLPAELIPHNFPEVETSGKEILKQETFYEVQSWGCVSALLGLPAELIPHKIQEANLLDGVFCWELIVAGLSDWGCVLIPTGLPAELIPHAGLSFGVVLLTTCVIIPAQREIVNRFLKFLKQNSPAGFLARQGNRGCTKVRFF